jgi:hypothetical protein
MSATAKAATTTGFASATRGHTLTGNGFNIQIETVPLDGRITLPVASEKTK